MIKCNLGLQLSVWIMQVSLFSSVHVNRLHCMRCMVHNKRELMIVLYIVDC